MVKNKMKTQTSLHKNEQGLAAVVITVFVMVMLSLVVLAFSQVSRQEQRQALDRQLSSQAFYSAEAGINKRVSDIRSGAVTAPIIDKCSTASTNIDTQGTTGYSCVLHNKQPVDLQYRITQQDNKFVSLKTPNYNLDVLNVSWKGTNGGQYTNCASVGAATYSLPKASSYASSCPAGIVRIELAYVNNGDLSQNALANNTFTVFLRPTNNATSIPSAPFSTAAENQGAIVGARCDNATGYCSANITGIPRGSVYAQLRSIYQDSDITLKGQDVVQTTNVVRFNDAQIIVDATGKSQDVLRRLQVRVPLYEHTLIPGQAVSSANGICKQLDVFPDKTESTGGDNGCLGSGYFN